MTELSAIVLAAGHSSRMGELKPLLRLGDRTLLARAVAAFSSVGIEDVVVVTGHRGAEVADAAEALGARPIANPRFEHGMFTSVQAGAAAVGEGRRFFLLPVDCPLVRPETIGRVARAGAAAGAEAAVPAYAGRSGHPPLLAPALRPAILASEPAGGLRELLAGRRQLLVEVDDPGVLYDADTSADVEALLVAARGEELPSDRRCLELLHARGADEARVAHAVAVAAVAATLAAALNERQQCLCVPLVTTAALLHDVARDRPHHADAGADLLRDLGYARLAVPVRSHMRLRSPLADQLDEAQIVYLADKLVLGDRRVTLDERFGIRLEQVAGDAGAREGVLARLAAARVVQARVEKVLGRPLDPGVLG